MNKIFEKEKVEKEFVVCGHCNSEVEKNHTVWIKDRYGIPYKRVCFNCSEEVQEQILKYEYNYLDAGEYLDDY